MKRSLSVIILVAAFSSLNVSADKSPDAGAQYYLDGKYDLAAREWAPMAEDGDPVAQHNLGVIHRDGLGSAERDLNQAAILFMRSAQAGYVPAMVSLAEVQSELGNDQAANSWLTLAARWGNIEAIDYLKDKGLKVPKADLYVAASGEMKLAKMRAVGELIRPPIRKNDIPKVRISETDR